MPTPRKGEKQNAFISRCISQLVKDEKRPQKQAIAICHQIWRDRKKKKHEEDSNEMEKQMLFRASVARGIKEGVDRENEIIKGFAVVTKGVTSDARGEFDDESLETIIKMGNKDKKGMKSRFGHPNMSSTALGTFLGRIKKFRRDEDVVRADLHIDSTAHNTPDGDLASYVMDLAESDSDAFGSSMVIKWEAAYRQEKDGTLTKDKKTGESLPPLIKVQKLRSVDVVDDPAANNGMFGMDFFQGTNVKFSAEMTDFLDKFLENPDAIEKIVDFLQKYTVNRDYIDDHEEENENEEEVHMKFGELTIEKLKAERSDLYKAIYKEGYDAAKEEGKTGDTAASDADGGKKEEAKEEEKEEKVEEKVEEKKEEAGEKDAGLNTSEEKLPQEFEKKIVEKDEIIAQKNATIAEKDSEIKKLNAEKAVEAKWVTLSESYKEEDAEEIKGILLKAELGEALTSEETETLIAKKSGESSLIASTESVVDDGMSQERKNELIKIGGIKTKQ